MRIRVVVIVTLLLAAGLASPVPRTADAVQQPAGSAPKALVGAIRWDGWFEGNSYEKNLLPKKWHGRLPFFAEVLAEDNEVLVRADSQEVMDQEIDYAAASGLRYWAFCWYHPRSFRNADQYNHGLKHYLASARQPHLGFCLLLQGQHLGLRYEWPRTVQTLVRYFKEPTYQTVLDRRPLVFLRSLRELRRWSGSASVARTVLDRFRLEALRTGLKNPYLVALVDSPAEGVECVEQLGFDAVSSYSMPAGRWSREHPFRDLAQANRDFWEGCKATGKPVIPIVNLGWDDRPRRAKPGPGSPIGPWFTAPTPTELADHVRAAVAWNQSNPASARANAVLLYAWNEFDEGGWLAPTHAEGTARLDALQGVLKPVTASPP